MKNLFKSKAYIIKLIWNGVAENAGLSNSGKDYKEKYNFLLKEFKRHQVISKKTGEGKICWKYWNLMSNNCIVGHKIVLPSANDTINNDDLIEIEDSNNTENSSIKYSEKKSSQTSSKNDLISKLSESLDSKNSIKQTFFKKRKKSMI